MNTSICSDPLVGELALSELEVIEMPQEGASAPMCLMDETGRYLYASSPEAAALHPGMRRGQRYLWALCLQAVSCGESGQECVLSQGSLFEMEKHSCSTDVGVSAPPDYAPRFSFAGMRQLDQHAGSSHTHAVGVVQCVHEYQADSDAMVCLRICFLAGNDAVSLNVCAARSLLGDYCPQPGDNIRCSGELQAKPVRRLKGASWIDSPEVGRAQDRRMRQNLALRAYAAEASCSIATAALKFALVNQGWTMGASLWPYLNRFDACNQSGERALFAVDTHINGKAPTSPASVAELEGRDLGHEITAGRYVISMKVEYLREARCYAVELLDDGGFAQRLNLPRYVGRPFAPQLMLHGACQIPPEQLEKEMLVRYTLGVRERRWTELAPWFVEEVSFCNQADGFRCTGKQEMINYLAQRREQWAEADEGESLHLRYGTASHQGSRQPCCALYVNGKEKVLTFFALSDGLVTGVLEAPADFKANFEPSPDSPDGLNALLNEPWLNDIRINPDALVDMEEFLLKESLGVTDREKEPLDELLDFFAENAEAPDTCEESDDDYNDFILPRDDDLDEPDDLDDFDDDLFLFDEEDEEDTEDTEDTEVEDVKDVEDVEDEEDALVDWESGVCPIRAAEMLAELEAEYQNSEAAGAACDAEKEVNHYFWNRSASILSAQTLPGLEPQIWFEDEQGERCWLLLRAAESAEARVDLASWAAGRVSNLSAYRGFLLRSRRRPGSLQPQKPVVDVCEMREVTPGDWALGYE